MDLWVPDHIGVGGAIDAPYLDAMADYLAPVDRQVAEFAIVNDNTVQTLWSKLIPGGTLGSSTPEGVLIGRLRGTYLNNTGVSTYTLLVKILLDATPIWGDTTPVITTSAAERVWTFDFMVWLQNATNSVRMSGLFEMSDAAAAGVAGEGNLDGTPIVSARIAGGTSTVDLSADHTLSVQTQHSHADATLSIKRELALLQLR